MKIKTLKKRYVILILFLLSYIILKIIPIIDTRNVENGDIVHPNFRFAIFENDKFIGTKELNQNYFPNKNLYSSTKTGKREIKNNNNHTVESYNIISQSDGEVIIEVFYTDSNEYVWSTYMLDGEYIRPLKSKFTYPGHMFFAFGISFTFICLIYLCLFITKYFFNKKQNELS